MYLLDLARSKLEACFDWTDTAKYIGEREYNIALDTEWEAMKEEAILEQQLPIAKVFGSLSTRRM